MIVVMGTAALQYIEPPLRCHCDKQKDDCRKRKLRHLSASGAIASKRVSNAYGFQI